MFLVMGDPWHPNNAGTEHVRFSPTRQTLQDEKATEKILILSVSLKMENSQNEIKSKSNFYLACMLQKKRATYMALRTDPRRSPCPRCL